MAIGTGKVLGVEPLIAADDRDKQDAAAELEGRLDRIGDAGALTGLWIGWERIDTLRDIGGGGFGNVERSALPLRALLRLLSSKRRGEGSTPVVAETALSRFELGVADDKAVYHHLDGMLFIFVELNIFAQVADLAVDPDTHIASTTHLLENALVLALA